VTDWDRAACRDADPDMFFPALGDVAAIRHARGFCLRCPVARDCFESALASDAGMWGGMTGSQRRRIRRGETTFEEQWAENAKPPPAPPPERTRPGTYTWEDWVVAARIVSDTARSHGLPRQDVIGGSRKREAVLARQEAMARIYRQTAMSYPKIGQMFSRDYTTVIYSVRRAEQRQEAA